MASNPISSPLEVALSHSVIVFIYSFAFNAFKSYDPITLKCNTIYDSSENRGNRNPVRMFGFQIQI
jgi:hypothetical protein